ncbi:hypothetical protein LTR91_011074 [Friedmanniomyces endolithicus]|uniref:NADP-dependent oxidoreductase domain-containing protein n=1 Tax=Friedmanniomyces endolithicus TaxID=329885 RepID=A0AAN6QS55_9PEZI|nr:hypothetical protein LTR35_005613 [Friedmanniomyces endolithicus]KAK0297641.1 hypothetical protein LTS00_003774 [Friedmanniomyces endolithicus]KAK0930689.1 hypothetical protein LTR57_001069 [Friedmanniomyces endolithicus]KAK0984015.1 hypothetical protein LTR91_011074 [Friedmanniomyces endolithicus]KAK1009046.1 hypothetical protein LTR54_005847 [Friedmanniomyces endolithicus]
MTATKAGRMPALIYGTAWKKDNTRELVRQALTTGFRGIDTAAQPKHYREDLVGRGIADAMRQNGINREDLYIQTKYTSLDGHDRSNMPYDAKSSISEQVYIDCLVLHSPLPTQSQTFEAWQAMESFVPKHVRTIGISNVYHLPILTALYESASVKPTVVQNRFYRDTGYDREIRAFCKDKGMTYQSFWTLTANPDLLRSHVVNHIAACVGVSRPVALYGLVLSLGNMSILDGTTSVEHMKDDLKGVHAVQSWLVGNDGQAVEVCKNFAALLE